MDMCHRHNMDCFIRSVDDDDPITQHQRPRGYGGVAIAFKRDMSKQCTSIPDGTCAVQPIIIQATPRDLCIINVYLPCRGNHSESESGLSNNREIRVFPRTAGNTGISREIPGNTGKYREIPRNIKYIYIP